MSQSTFIAARTASGASLQIAREEAERLLLEAGYESREPSDRWRTPDGRMLTSEQALPEAVPMLASLR
jgi:hypothetical protein